MFDGFCGNVYDQHFGNCFRTLNRNVDKSNFCFFMKFLNLVAVLRVIFQIYPYFNILECIKEQKVPKIWVFLRKIYFTNFSSSGFISFHFRF